MDRFGPVLSLQTLTAGMDQRKELLCDLLEELLHPDAIYERNDVKVREKEGLAQQKGLLRGALPGELLVRENGFLLKVDVAGGQKTGSYLDQRENHAALAPYVRGRRVLDVCCCTGGFGPACGQATARRMSRRSTSRPQPCARRRKTTPETAFSRPIS